MSYLIIGGDSSIGKALKAATGGYSTTRKKAGYFLDLEDPDMAKLPKTDIAIVCAAMTDKKECESKKDVAFRINCTNTLTLCNTLQEQGTHVILLSTDAVFGNSYYGYTKRCLEKALDLGEATVIRLSKIITKDFSLFEEWYVKFKDNKKVFAYDNLYVAPIYIDYAINGIVKIAESKRKGIYQISARDKVNYYQMALHMAGNLDTLVKNTFYKDADEFTLMGTRRFKYLTKEDIPSSFNAIDQWVKNYEN